MTKQELLKAWEGDYGLLKNMLFDLGDKPDSQKYNVLAAEAMRLHECILGLERMED